MDEQTARWVGEICLEVGYLGVDYEKAELVDFPSGVTNGIITTALIVAPYIEQARIKAEEMGVDYWAGDVCELVAEWISEGDFGGAEGIVERLKAKQ